MSGVKNLRAMFEIKEDSGASPPDRGRSPAGSIGGGSSGTSPRPLSKVRTNFVAVERNGQHGSQWGLRKESSTDSSLAERRMSFSVNADSDPKAVAAQKETIIGSELAARKASSVITETIPEAAVETPVESETKPSYTNGKAPLGRVALAPTKSSAKPNKETSAQEEDAKLLTTNPTSSEAVGGAAMTNSGRSRGTMNGKGDGNVKPSISTRSPVKSATAERSIKPAADATSMTINTNPISKPAKLPSVPKTPTTPARSSRALTSKPMASANSTAPARSLEKRASKPSLSSASTSKPPGRPMTASTVASTSETKSAHTSPSTGFHKPKPRSPTRPVKLPPSLTAPTNSSLSKVAPGATASTRQSLAPPTKAVSRSPSQNSLASKASNAQLRRKPSKLNENDRPALGRPSASAIKRQPSRQSLSKDPIVPDESFLARMMRPTTSSASKTAEKVVTPPRKPLVARPIADDVPKQPPSHSKEGVSYKTTVHCNKPISDDVPKQLLGHSKEGLPYKTTMHHHMRQTDGDGLDMAVHNLLQDRIASMSNNPRTAKPPRKDEKPEALPFTGHDGANGKVVTKAVETMTAEAPTIDSSADKPVVLDMVKGKGKEMERKEEEVELLALSTEEEVPVDQMKMPAPDGDAMKESQPAASGPPTEKEAPVKETKVLTEDDSDISLSQPEETTANVEIPDETHKVETAGKEHEENVSQVEEAKVVDPESVTA